MKFIRKNGRVIPIRDDAQRKPSVVGAAHHGKFAIAGAAQSLVRKNKKLFIATAAVSGVANLVNSIQHGREKNSFLHGAARFYANNFSEQVGSFATSIGVKRAVHGLKSPALRKKVKAAGVSWRARGDGVMKKPNTGMMKEVNSSLKRLSGNKTGV